MENNILTVSNLVVEFNNHKILDNLSFEVKRDDTLAIIGPNGAGKTVLFKCLLNLLPYKGTVSWADDTRIGYVPQRLTVSKDIPLTVEEFLKFKEKDQVKIESVLSQVGFETKDEHLIHKGKRLLKVRLGVLSGGEFQRVLIAFALLGNPNVLLFDEPTSGVDVSSEETVYVLIDRLKKEKDLTIIFISHELEIVYRYAANVLCLNKEMVCWGPPHIAIDKRSINKLYGEDVRFYQHHNHNHKHE
ncbi:MAG: hypothetical protein UT39_C0002G0022 [Candidatus Woesebacteria bacterium GW2011_GWA1_39_21]|uniref:ABC transporter domain-containing protein n=1 Tax=Candidatus Woesebacteria bacterium GW2011_GWA1_39_21 TaxID=1618550 RepID=A0A0G0NG97_9BACT|nr:MAG: hypothetical protein UT39_C0002G0022 [Candidatus Woesebacteria bacterium GW2011_GWA1_39_21]